jgi:hypothetical protein
MAKRPRDQGTAGREEARTAPEADYDSPWKEALDHYFERCIAFFFSHIHPDIDWSRGYEMLDKELQPIIRRAERGRLYVDKLVKVWLKDGQEKWLLIHIEVQAAREGEFAERMHVYNHRIADRYGREVISLAILADDDPSGRPDRYEYSRWGFQTLTKFPVVKLLDYAAEYEELESNPNPFAVVVLAQLKAMETRRAPAERRVWKIRLIKGLYERGMGPEDVRQLFRFIDWVMELPDPLDRLFKQEVGAFYEERRMPFLDFFDQVALQKDLLQAIEICLKLKFGAEGLELMPELREVRDIELLRKILKRMESVDSPAALRRIWTRKRRPKKAEPL